MVLTVTIETFIPPRYLHHLHHHEIRLPFHPQQARQMELLPPPKPPNLR
jgi:hypothetical protein